MNSHPSDNESLVYAPTIGHLIFVAHPHCMIFCIAWGYWRDSQGPTDCSTWLQLSLLGLSELKLEKCGNRCKCTHIQGNCKILKIIDYVLARNSTSITHKQNFLQYIILMLLRKTDITDMLAAYWFINAVLTKSRKQSVFVSRRRGFAKIQMERPVSYDSVLHRLVIIKTEFTFSEP